MLFSRIVDFPQRLNTAMASTAIGIEAETVSPALSARHTFAAPKMMPKIAPRTIAFRENSGNTCVAGTNGWKLLLVSAMMGSCVVFLVLQFHAPCWLFNVHPTTPNTEQ